MAHGTRDWGAFQSLDVVYGVHELGELSARLGSIVTVDRRGTVMLLDDFDDAPLKWYVDTGGAGESATHCTTNAKRGAGSVEIANVKDALSWVMLDRFMENPQVGSMGIEFSFTLHTSIPELWVGVNEILGGLRYRPRIRLRPGTGDISVFDSGAAWAVIDSGFNLVKNDYMWYTAKLVYDRATGYYKRAIFGGQEYDLSSYAIPSDASVADPWLNPFLYVAGSFASAATNYADDFILTQNEP